MTIHTAHAQKHFSPETKSKVRPKFFFALLPLLENTVDVEIEDGWGDGAALSQAIGQIDFWSGRTINHDLCLHPIMQGPNNVDQGGGIPYFFSVTHRAWRGIEL